MRALQILVPVDSLSFHRLCSAFHEAKLLYSPSSNSLTFPFLVALSVSSERLVSSRPWFPPDGFGVSVFSFLHVGP